jgi:hypothetical protein
MIVEYIRYKIDAGRTGEFDEAHDLVTANGREDSR